MDIKALLKLVNRYKWILILVPLITVTITYFLVQKLPKQYKSTVDISTGLLDPNKKVISDQTVDFFKISQQFNSIMEKMKMKRIINLLSYNLIIHDLEFPQNRFRKYSEKLDSLNQNKRQELLALYKQKQAARSILVFSDDNGKYKLYSIIESMGYGEDALRTQLDVNHAENSDLIKIEYVSEDPDLSAYVVNSLAKEFIADYTYDVNANEANSNQLLDSIVRQKKADLDRKSAALASFKLEKGVTDLPTQAAAVNGQVDKARSDKADIQVKIDQDQAALDEINNQLRSGDPDINGSSKSDNRELVSLITQLRAAQGAYVDHATPANRRRLDSLTTLVNIKRDQNSNDNLLNPQANKQSLYTQKQQLTVDLKRLKASFRIIDMQMSSASAQFSKMMPYGGELQTMQSELEQANKDYTDALNRYNNSRVIQNVNGFRLQIDQAGLPGYALPSKRAIYLAGAGFGSLALSLGFIMLMFSLDHSINDLRQLERSTKSKAIGALNMIQSNERYIKEIWNDKSGNQNYEIHRDLLRSLRFEVSNAMDADESKILGITSLFSGDGKTFIAYGLAYAFAMTGKKILLIADELPVVKSDNQELAKSQNFEAFLVKKEISTEDLITILSKNMVKNSLLESQSAKSLLVGFEKLRVEFDLIIIDVNSLHDMNIAKEWLLFTEKNVAVFEAGKSLNENDIEFINYIKKKPGFIGWILNKMKVQG
jgi:succinoglycan biosynthesis transport protein ExoP